MKPQRPYSNFSKQDREALYHMQAEMCRVLGHAKRLQILDLLAGITGRSAPRMKMPHAVALAAGYADSVVSRMLGREPRIPLEGVRMARHRMWVDASKAGRELGFQTGSIEAALERAVRWYQENGYVGGRLREGVARAA